MKKKNEDRFNLERFINTQSLYYSDALEEVKSGRKKTHWMWYIFPQLKELGISETAKFYGISGMEEAMAYINNQKLRERLIEISEALLHLETDNAEEIFGWPDEMKLRSCMTLFEQVVPEIDVFGKVIEKYYKGERDSKTLKLLGL